MLKCVFGGAAMKLQVSGGPGGAQIMHIETFWWNAISERVVSVWRACVVHGLSEGLPMGSRCAIHGQ
jgi:hypothetical protein